MRARVDEKMPDNWAWTDAAGVNGQQPYRVQRGATEQAALLEKAHNVFQHWLGQEYDLDGLDATLAAAAIQQMNGETLWLLLVSGSGNAKTETVQSLSVLPGSHVVSTIASEGALLSATAKRDKTKDATGGLLREIGERGVLVIKDVTSILSMGRELRAQVLAALREIYDGRWTRTVGTDGGRRLEWSGQLTVIGAVTTAWDTAHAVIAAMGDRFVLVRLDSAPGAQPPADAPSATPAASARCATSWPKRSPTCLPVRWTAVSRSPTTKPSSFSPLPTW